MLTSPWGLESGVLAQLGMSCVASSALGWKMWEQRLRAGLFHKTVQDLSTSSVSSNPVT